MKKTISNPFVTLIVLLLTVFSSGVASAAGEWTVNPANYRYDMSLYLEVAFAGNEETFDHTRFDVASFVGDECRGVAETIAGVDGCLYMRVRSNSESGESLSFKLRNRQTGEVRDVEGVQISFEANKAIGMPSAPFKLVVQNYYDVSITASEGGSVNVESGRYPEGTTLEVSAVPDDQYSFDEWSDGVKEADRTIVVDGDISLVANFAVTCYKLTYLLDGEVYHEETVPYGSKIAAASAPEKEGCTFSGWEGLPEVMPAKDVTVSGSFTVNSYKLTYVVDGEVYLEETVAYGSKIAAAPAPEKEGYTFSGWEGLPEVMPAKDVTVSGSFAVNSYKLTYLLDGEVYLEETVAYGSKIAAASAPEKEGYTFSGWEGLPEVMPAKDVTVSGSFTVNSYKLTYVVDGEVYLEETVAYGSKIAAAPAPEKEGCTFSGWEGLPEVMPAKDVTVSGSFTVNSYKLTYVVDGEVYLEETVSYGSKIAAASAPEKEGYTFSGWEGLPEVMPAKDVTVSGSFAVNSYKLTYLLDGEVYLEETVAYGSKIAAAPAPEKEGCTFSGWEGLPEVMPAKDVTVSGSFTVNSYKLTYVVDGEVYLEETVAYGSKIAAAPAPEKEGYTFSGWEGLPEVMPAKDVTVSGSFTVNSYKLTYVVDGEVYLEETVAYGSKIAAAPAPEKEGCTFSGWEGLPEVMPAKDVTVSGSFTVNSYKLTYVVDGEVYLEETVPYGSKIAVASAPEKEGYTFSGWEGLPEVMPAKDVTVSGSFTVNSYKLTYVVDGEVYLEETVPYGSEIAAASAPEKEGYTFSGWEGLPEVMPAKDVTVTAVYDVNYYKLTVYLDGEVYFEAELEMGAEINIPDPELPSDKVFDGWVEEIPETMPSHDVEIHGTTSVYSGLSSIFADEDTLFTVYNIRGVLLMKDVTLQEASKKLTGGFYIINGRKVMIR